MLETLALETLCGGQCTCTLQTQLIKQIIWFSLLCFALLYKHQVQVKIYPMISAQQQQRHLTAFTSGRDKYPLLWNKGCYIDQS